jgi:hypothetical protein
MRKRWLDSCYRNLGLCGCRVCFVLVVVVVVAMHYFFLGFVGFGVFWVFVGLVVGCAGCDKLLRVAMCVFVAEKWIVGFRVFHVAVVRFFDYAPL